MTEKIFRLPNCILLTRSPYPHAKVAKQDEDYSLKAAVFKGKYQEIFMAAVCGITFTYGGLKVNEKCQAIDTREIPIAGLYAIGEMSRGVFYHN